MKFHVNKQQKAEELFIRLYREIREIHGTNRVEFLLERRMIFPVITLSYQISLRHSITLLWTSNYFFDEIYPVFHPG